MLLGSSLGMNFSSEESEGERSFRGMGRQDIETYIQSTLVILRSFQESAQHVQNPSSCSPVPLPHSFERIISQDIQKPLPLHDIFVRYQEIKQQLSHQHRYLVCSTSQLPKGAVIDKRVQVTHYLSWPEHFHRRKLIPNRLEPVTPWEGSQYLLTLLSSLADKLLLKYCFQYLHSLTRYLRRSTERADESYEKKCFELLQRIFVAWKGQWRHLLTNRVLHAKGYRCHVSSLLRRGYRTWRAFVLIRVKYQKLCSLVTHRHRNKCFRWGLSSLRRIPERDKRRMRLINRSRGRRVAISTIQASSRTLGHSTLEVGLSSYTSDFL